MWRKLFNFFVFLNLLCGIWCFSPKYFWEFGMYMGYWFVLWCDFLFWHYLKVTIPIKHACYQVHRNWYGISHFQAKRCQWHRHFSTLHFIRSLISWHKSFHTSDLTPNAWFHTVFYADHVEMNLKRSYLWYPSTISFPIFQWSLIQRDPREIEISSNFFLLKITNLRISDWVVILALKDWCKLNMSMVGTSLCPLWSNLALNNSNMTFSCISCKLSFVMKWILDFLIKNQTH